MNYVATFHTHLAALRTFRALEALGVEARMAPVPRRLSSSCGTCVFFTAAAAMEEALDADLEALYRREGEEYALLRENR